MITVIVFTTLAMIGVSIAVALALTFAALLWRWMRAEHWIETERDRERMRRDVESKKWKKFFSETPILNLNRIRTVDTRPRKSDGTPL